MNNPQPINANMKGVEDAVPILKPFDKNRLENYIKHHIPVILDGPPGVGKSLIARYFSEKIYKEKCDKNNCYNCEKCKPIKIDITEDTEIRHLLGDVDYRRLLMSTYIMQNTRGMNRDDLQEYIEEYFVDGPVLKAMKEGRVLIIEELDRAGRDTLFPILFDVIEYKEVYVPELKKKVKAVDGFNVIITMNVEFDIGTIRLPAAFIRRCRRIHIENPTIEKEKEIVLSNIQNDERIKKYYENSREDLKELVSKMVNIVSWLNKLEPPLEHYITPSETVSWVKDILTIYGEKALWNLTAEEYKNMIHYTRGAVCKTKNDEIRIISMIERYGTENNMEQVNIRDFLIPIPTQSGTISGKVNALNNIGVPNVTVVLSDPNNHNSRLAEAITDYKGNYMIHYDEVPIGSYKIIASAEDSRGQKVVKEKEIKIE
jgi:MoxR-like ATPase